MNDYLSTSPFGRLSEVTKRRLLMIVVGLMIQGALLAIFLIFVLNRGAVALTAQAPYSVEIENIKKVDCHEAECRIELSPGLYTLRIRKNGYREELRSIEVPLNGTYAEAISFHFLPLLQEVNDSAPIEEKQSDLLSLQRLEGNFRQALYLKKIGQTEPTLITSFIRDLRDPLLQLAPDQSKVLVADRAEAGATLYLVDRTQNTRTIAGNYALIRELKWLPDSRNFLLYGRKPGELEDSIFLIALPERTETRLDLKTSLQNVAFLDQHTFIAVTGQDIGIERNPEAFEGKPVVLGSYRSNTDGKETYFSVIGYDSLSNVARLLKIVSGPLPNSIQLDGEGKGIYFRQEMKNFYLRFRE